MTFKYYGYKVSKSDGRKQAFLLDGDDIIIAGENDPVKLERYKVVRIGVSSITIEDTQFKSTQTLQHANGRRAVYGCAASGEEKRGTTNPAFALLFVYAMAATVAIMLYPGIAASCF